MEAILKMNFKSLISLKYINLGEYAKIITHECFYPYLTMERTMKIAMQYKSHMTTSPGENVACPAGIFLTIALSSYFLILIIVLEKKLFV